MKSVGMQYLEALKQLKKDGETFLRTIHLTFVPGGLSDGTYCKWLSFEKNHCVLYP